MNKKKEKDKENNNEDDGVNLGESLIVNNLKNTYQNITKIKNIFILMQNIGAQGESFLKNLMKYVPELNEASPQNNTEKDEKQNEEKKSETFEESKKVLQKIDEINNLIKNHNGNNRKKIQLS